jgi:DNA-binding XRE family transcriptional regulator
LGLDTVACKRQYACMQLTLKAAREKHRPKLTKAALAEKVGVHKSTIGRIENGEVRPLHETVTAMEAAMGLKPGTLVFHSEVSR